MLFQISKTSGIGLYLDILSILSNQIRYSTKLKMALYLPLLQEKKNPEFNEMSKRRSGFSASFKEVIRRDIGAKFNTHWVA